MVNRTVAIQSFLLMMGASVALAEGFSFSTQRSVQPAAIGRGSFPAAMQISQKTDTLAFFKVRGGAINTRGGVRYAEPTDDDVASATGIVGKTVSAFGSVWGSMGVVYILLKAVKRVMPIAMEPLKAGSTLALSQVQWG